MRKHFLGIWMCLLAVLEISAAEPTFYKERAVQNYERNWNRLQTEGPWEKFSVRMPADYLFAMTAARTDGSQVPLERAGALLDLIRSMQDLDPDSPAFGNFRWYWFQSVVDDRHAVEFVVQRLIYCKKHAEIFEPEIQKKLDDILRDARFGLMKHRVRTDYTNICVLNFTNLLLVGEAYDSPDLRAEGRRRMDAFLFWTRQNGFHEFSSPTYAAVTLEGLELLENLTTDPRVRTEAHGLLEFLALDICAHFHPGVSRYTGGWSRTYNYLHGDASLGFHLGRWGWMPLPEKNSNIVLCTAFTSDFAPERTEFAKDVRLRWDAQPWNFTTTRQTDSYALGTSASAYGTQDVLLALDICARPDTRGFYMMEARNDPYGVVRTPTGGGHDKSLHLPHAWRAVQRGNEVLALSVLPPDAMQKLPDPDAPIRSHFIFPRPDRWELAPDTRTLTLHYADVSAVLHVVWGDFSTPNSAVFEDSPDGSAFRWTFEHGTPADCLRENRVPSMVLYVKVETENSRSDNELAENESETAVHVRTSAPCGLETSDGKLRLDFPELENLKELTNNSATLMTPAPPEDILEWNGENVGRKRLEEQIPVLKAYADACAAWKTSAVTLGASGELLPETALVFPGFREPDGSIRVRDRVSWRFRVTEPGRYVLRATVWAPDPQHDSVRVRLTPQDPALPAVFYPCWALGSSESWRDVAFPDARFDLRPGIFKLELTPREYDARIQKIQFQLERNTD